MSEESCGNCRFLLGEGGRTGECRRNPPTVLNDNEEFQFPEMSRDDWCGEWRPKDAAGATGRLYQLPNGQWITPSMVLAVAAHTDQRGPYALVCFCADGGSHEIDCPTKEAAEAMRDKIAADVNAMVGGAA